jgi:endonuclease I
MKQAIHFKRNIKATRRAVLSFGLIVLFLAGFAEIPPGYYNTASGLTGTALQAALHNIIKNHTPISYTPGIWNAFYTTDDKPNGTVWDIYSDIPDGTPNGNPPYVYQFGTDQCGTASQEGDCYSREHSFPKAWFGGEVAPMYTDLFHIYPVDQYVNNRHSDYPMGKVGTATWTSQNGCKLGPCVTSGYTGTVFEPRDDYKGDIARSYFYMATRYYTEDTGWPGSPMVTGSQPNPWALAMLLQWHEQDPVSQKEIDRNNAIYAIQHNRNPFIDHPEYAENIWVPNVTPKPEPTNHVTNFTVTIGSPSYSTIVLTWTDATGATIPDAYLIRGSTVSYADITAPVDGTPVADGGLNKNIYNGVQTYSFIGLYPSTTYYFKIFPYTNSGANINFKTNGTIPSGTATTGIGSGSGSLVNPYTCSQAIGVQDSSYKWVSGYIVGYVLSSVSVDHTPPFLSGQNTNLAISDNMNDTIAATMLFVQLPNTIIRTNLNLYNNQSNFHKKVLVYGMLTQYFIPHPGLKLTSDYKWDDPTSSILTGLWGTATTWSTGIPYQHDNVTVSTTVTVDADAPCNNLTVGTTGTLIINLAKTVTINGDFTVNGTLTNHAGNSGILKKNDK